MDQIEWARRLGVLAPLSDVGVASVSASSNSASRTAMARLAAIAIVGLANFSACSFPDVPLRCKLVSYNA